MPSDQRTLAADPVKELRSLKRSGFAARPERVRELLNRVDDVLDAEAAGALVAAQREALADTGAFRETSIALLGSSTLDPLPNLLTTSLAAEGILPRVGLAGYDQWRFELLAGAPALKGLNPRITACLLDAKVIFEQVTDLQDVNEIAAVCAGFPAQLSAWAESCREELGGLVVLSTLPLPPLHRDRIVDYGNKARLEAAWQEMNAAILRLAEETPRTIVLSAEGIGHRAGRVFADHRMRHIASHAYAQEFFRAYAQELGRVARADLGGARRCLVLDLDNTLWGGVVGDDGLAGIQVGGDYPGAAHRELQELARDLKSQGVVLAVSSKNDAEAADQALASHPEMVLRPDSFVSVRADWQPKPDHLRALAKELNIGLDSMVFLDDNPVERGLMRQSLPEVATVELPREPADFASVLAARGDFTTLVMTGEDRRRTAMYQARARRNELLESATDLEGYLLKLDTTLAVEPADEFNSARIAQLFAKTNQFNLTGRRFGLDDIHRQAAVGGTRFFGVRVTDRFGDNGLAAAVAISAVSGAWTIDNFVLSCRVFSRNVEEAIAGLLLRAAKRQGATAVLSDFVETAKNRKFAGFYPALGFVRAGEPPSTGFRHTLDEFAAMPRWIRYPAEEVFHVD